MRARASVKQAVRAERDSVSVKKEKTRAEGRREQARKPEEAWRRRKTDDDDDEGRGQWNLNIWI